MRVKRLKKANKILAFFHYNYGFDPPYQVLLDGNFCQAALRSKINIMEQVPKYFSENTEMCVTDCILNELGNLGKELHGALIVARQFKSVKCPHKPLRTASECIAHLARRSKSVDKKRPKYIVATQDENLLEKLRTTGGIPIMSIRWNSILLEQPSKESHEGILKPVDIEFERAKALKTSIFGEPNRIRKKKKPKAPNPLSCKKKKMNRNENPSRKKVSETDDIALKRRRSRPKPKKTMINNGNAD